jgi:hypothetical protein
MSHHNLPEPLRERLLTYYKAQRQYRQFGFENNDALEDLPVYMRREMQVRSCWGAVAVVLGGGSRRCVHLCCADAGSVACRGAGSASLWGMLMSPPSAVPRVSSCGLGAVGEIRPQRVD